MTTGVQFTGALAANQTVNFFTFNWNPLLHVVWYVVPVTPKPGAPEVDWEVSVERASPTATTYWIKVINKTNVPITVEGRFAILN